MECEITPAWRKATVYRHIRESCSLSVWESWQGTQRFLLKQRQSAGRGTGEWYNNCGCFYDTVRWVCTSVVIPSSLLPNCFMVFWVLESFKVLLERLFLTNVQLTHDDCGSLGSDHGYLVVIGGWEGGEARRKWGREGSSEGKRDQQAWCLEPHCLSLNLGSATYSLCASGQVFHLLCASVSSYVTDGSDNMCITLRASLATLLTLEGELLFLLFYLRKDVTNFWQIPCGNEEMQGSSLRVIP